MNGILLALQLTLSINAPDAEAAAVSRDMAAVLLGGVNENSADYPYSMTFKDASGATVGTMSVTASGVAP